MYLKNSVLCIVECKIGSMTFQKHKLEFLRVEFWSILRALFLFLEGSKLTFWGYSIKFVRVLKQLFEGKNLTFWGYKCNILRVQLWSILRALFHFWGHWAVRVHFAVFEGTNGEGKIWSILRVTLIISEGTKNHKPFLFWMPEEEDSDPRELLTSKKVLFHRFQK